jgi:uncharacterized membrane protein (DUF4010 family)
MELPTDVSSGFATAIGIGLLIGTVREKMHGDRTTSGIRTHALLAVISSVAMTFGLTAFLVIFAVLGGLTAVGYRDNAAADPGLTGEVAMLATAMLAALASQNPPLASALAVVVAGLLFAKIPLRRFSREILSTTELQDGLLLCAAILVVLPLLPKDAIDPWGVLQPYALWRIVVLIMGVGMAGHVALRVVGTYWGFPLAGFFSGFVSSTAATASFGHHVRQDQGLLNISVAASLLSNVASLLLFGVVLQFSAVELFYTMLWPLTAALLSLLAMAVFWMRHSSVHGQAVMQTTAHAFKISHALIITFTISGVLLLSVWIGNAWGESGAIASAVFVGLGEIHAAAISLAHLSLQAQYAVPHLQWGLWGVLAASTLSKSCVAVLSGGWKFALRLASSLVLMLLSIAGVLVWAQL